MFKLEMLPAGHGDCLWLEYGDAEYQSRILIDGGTLATFDTLRSRIIALPVRQRKFELFIITHIDSDHIEGAIKLLGCAESLGVEFGEIWFNGWEHLWTEDDLLGGLQGEYLSALIKKGGHSWNKVFNHKAIVVPDEGSLPQHRLPGGMTLTLLSPTQGQLRKLRFKWNQEVRKAGLHRESLSDVLAHLAANRKLRPEDGFLGEKAIDVEKLAEARFISDSSEANGSSIAVLAEFGGKSCLLTGDAFATVLYGTIHRLLGGSSHKLMVDAFKLPHHGSRANINKELLNLLWCRRYLFSTNGNYFHHPDRESVARVIRHGGRDPMLFFNYYTEHNRIWDDVRLMRGKYPYEVFYPEAGGCSISIEL
jgi:hypothetical protein